MTNTTKTNKSQTTNKPEAPKMDDLVTLQLEPGTRITDRWLINPKFEGRERWFDKTKIHSFDDKKLQVTITRAEVQHRGMNGFILTK